MPKTNAAEDCNSSYFFKKLSFQMCLKAQDMRGHALRTRLGLKALAYINFAPFQDVQTSEHEATCFQRFQRPVVVTSRGPDLL